VPRPGPDKAADARIAGAFTGAGAGAVTGFQLGAGAGPGALVGAGVGAVAGGVRGFIHDDQEERDADLKAETQKAEARAAAQALIASYYDKRVRLHPTRDIFPADLFFLGDSVSLCPSGRAVLDEIFLLNKERFPWSRFGVAVYSRSQDDRSLYAKHLSERRALAISNHLIHSGIEPRRIEAHAVVVPEIIFVDPADVPDRYAQAVEFIPLDR
jgi:outer membrane protein OmpA-like peptidoglycan-associated protein